MMNGAPITAAFGGRSFTNLRCLSAHTLLTRFVLIASSLGQLDQTGVRDIAFLNFSMFWRDPDRVSEKCPFILVAQLHGRAVYWMEDRLSLF